MITVAARPYPFTCDIQSTALLIIDMQRDFLEPGGFGAMLGNDVEQLRTTIKPIQAVLETCRQLGMFVIHTREGHRPDLSDLPISKKLRGGLTCGIGDVGSMGRILIRGEAGHDIIEELRPLEHEPIIDKPGKGSFHATDLDSLLHNRGIKSLIVTGVTTEVCVHTTVREANDRGYECLVLSDCVGSYFPEFQRVALEMIAAQGGIFGWVSPSENLLSELNMQIPSDPIL
jgi:nicotinamidase-related amidase